MELWNLPLRKTSVVTDLYNFMTTTTFEIIFLDRIHEA